MVKQVKPGLIRSGVLVWPLLGLLVVAGCAAPPPPRQSSVPGPGQDMVLSTLLREFELRERQAFGGTDTPDTPVERSGQVGAPARAAAVTPPVSGSVGVAAADPLREVGQLTIQPDSVLRITVGEDPGLGGTYPVNDIGAIALGYIGPVVLYNLSEEEAKAKIQERLLAREFRTATVSVKIMRPSYDRCTIVGDVAKGGEIKLGAGDVVLLKNALMRAGGIRNAARYTNVRVVRGGMLSPFPHSLKGETYALADSKGNPSVPDITLANNDIAFVYTDAPRGASIRDGRIVGVSTRWVLVLGEVSTPGYIQFGRTEGFTMLNLILRMGGLPPYANDKAIRVLRRNAEGVEHEYRVNARAILKEGDPDLDFPLQNGDRIVVPARGFRVL